MAKGKPGPRRYPPELKDRAIRIVRGLRAQDPQDVSVILRVARQLGVDSESLRKRVKQNEIDDGRRAGLSREEKAELVRLRQENRELARANGVQLSTGRTREYWDNAVAECFYATLKR